MDFHIYWMHYIAVIIISASQLSAAWKENEKVLLKDVGAITLQNGQMTNARRSSPIPQLKCVGGSAKCGTFVPQVVQCYNRGFDGYDVQWECKTDMDNAYRFGKVEVSCEGFDYPDDPYILRGSCGLEYTLDLTKEGENQRNQGYQQHNYYGNQDTHTYQKKGSSSSFGDLIMLGIIGVIIYGIYKTCIAAPSTDAPPPYDDQWRRDNQGQPPRYGFRDEYMPHNDGGGCSSTSGPQTHQRHSNTTGAPNAGGFWGGAATGGILGYLLGSRTNTGYHTPPYNGYGYGGNRGWGTGWGSGWGSGFGSGYTRQRSSGSSGGSFQASSGTRTASGFGGTSRR